jgi:hypothetical protein
LWLFHIPPMEGADMVAVADMVVADTVVGDLVEAM